MSSPLLKAFFLLIVLPAVAIGGYMYWDVQQEFRRFQRFFDRVSVLIEQSVKDNHAEKNEAFGTGVRTWNEKVAGNLDVLYVGYRGVQNENIHRSIAITKTLFDEVFKLRREFIPVVEPLFSKRMRDRSTLKDKDSYEWRLSVLDNIDQYATQYDKRLQQIGEVFRQALSDSGLPERHRLYLWQDWAGNFNGVMKSLDPGVAYFEGVLPAYRALFAYMYKNRDYYFVRDDGSLAFDHVNYQTEYEKRAVLLGKAW